MRRHSVEEVELASGAKGLLIHVPGSPVFNYEINFRAGEYLIDDPKKYETAHLLEHLILGANKKYPDAKKFSAEIHKNGAMTNAYTGYYNVGYYGETADFEWQRLLKLQIMSLTQPLFLKKEFEAEWGNIQDEMIAGHNNHFRHLSLKMAQSLGFKYPTYKERAELMKNVQLSDLVEHYQNTHTLKNMRFMITGNLRGRKAKIVNILESIKLPEGGRLDLSIEKAVNVVRPIFIENETIDNIYFGISSFRNSMTDTKEDMAMMLNRILLTDTLHSKIFGTAREKGLVYSLHSSHHRSSELTEWWLSTQVLPENAPALCDIIIKELEKLRSGNIKENEINGSKKYALGTYQRSMQTVSSIAGSYSRYFFDEEIEELDKVPSLIKSITKQDMARVMDSMFNEKIHCVGVLGGKNPKISNDLDKKLSVLWG